MPIQFQRAAVDALYETDFENDPEIIVGCKCNNGAGYTGPLSNICIDTAEKLIEEKSNLVRRKTPPQAQDN